MAAGGIEGGSKAPERGARGHSSNSCTLRQAEGIISVWSYDFLFERTEDGRQAKILAIVDEHTRKLLHLDAARSIRGNEVIDALASFMAERGVPGHIRSDNGPEFAETAVQNWLAAMGSTTLFIQPGAPWENAYAESFNSRLRDELLEGEIFLTLRELRFVLNRWKTEYNDVRPHSALGYRTPAAFAAGCGPSGSASLRLQAHTPADACSAGA